MIPAHLADFWSEPRLATLGTVRPDGSPHLVPVKCMRAGEKYVVVTSREAVKVRHVASTVRASIVEHTSTMWALSSTGDCACGSTRLCCSCRRMCASGLLPAVIDHPEG